MHSTDDIAMACIPYSIFLVLECSLEAVPWMCLAHVDLACRQQRDLKPEVGPGRAEHHSGPSQGHQVLSRTLPGAGGILLGQNAAAHARGRREASQGPQTIRLVSFKSALSPNPCICKMASLKGTWKPREDHKDYLPRAFAHRPHLTSLGSSVKFA